MSQTPSFNKFVEIIKKEDFITSFELSDPQKWFSKKELEIFTLPNNLKSLAGRYLIKRTICDYINDHDFMYEIEILNNELGRPEVFFGPNILEKTKSAGIKSVLCSISHSKNFITGMTILSY